MKKLINLLVLFVFCLAANACKIDSDENATYKIETGQVNNEYYEIAVKMKNSFGANISFKRIKLVRDYLYEKTYSAFYEGVIKTELTKDEVYQFLRDLDATASTSYIDSQIKLLESNGNNLIFLSCENDEKTKWVYFQKE